MSKHCLVKIGQQCSTLSFQLAWYWSEEKYLNRWYCSVITVSSYYIECLKTFGNLQDSDSKTHTLDGSLILQRGQ